VEENMGTQPPSRRRSRNPAARKSAPQKTEYIYHWNRIFGASAALALCGGLIAFGLYAWLPAQSRPGVDMATGEAKESVVTGDEPAPEFGRAPPLVEGQVSGPAAIPDETVLPGDNTPLEELKIAEASGLVQQADGSGRVDAAAAVTPVATPAEPIPDEEGHDEASAHVSASLSEWREAEPGAREIMDLAQLEAIPAPVLGEIREASAPDADALPPQAEPTDAREKVAHDLQDAMIRATGASIASEAVQRFSLAPSVVGNEPRGDLGEIRPDAGGIARVAAFSEVRGLDGETLHYVWFHQGTEVARVRVPVRAGRWRSHSSKWVGAKETGAWRVELQDSGGAVLASIEFLI
jgi:hypothetical protein